MVWDSNRVPPISNNLFHFRDPRISNLVILSDLFGMVSSRDPFGKVN